MKINYISSESRGKTKISWLKSFHSFSFGGYRDPKRIKFRSLRVINDDYIAAQSGFDTHPHKDMEILTYVISGELSHKDSMGSAEVLRPGEIQRMSAGTGILHSEWNGSDKEVHMLQIWIEPKKNGIKPRYSQQPLEFQEGLTLAASRDGRMNSLQIEQDADMYILKLNSNQSLDILPFSKSEGGYLHLIDGQIDLVGTSHSLNPGDAVSIEDFDKISVKSNELGAHGVWFSLGS